MPVGIGGKGASPALRIRASACISLAFKILRSACSPDSSAFALPADADSWLARSSCLAAAVVAAEASFCARSCADLASSSWFSSETFSAARACKETARNSHAGKMEVSVL
jgi:hypothetical protein